MAVAATSMAFLGSPTPVAKSPPFRTLSAKKNAVLWHIEGRPQVAISPPFRTRSATEYGRFYGLLPAVSSVDFAENVAVDKRRAQKKRSFRKTKELREINFVLSPQIVHGYAAYPKDTGREIPRVGKKLTPDLR